MIASHDFLPKCMKFSVFFVNTLYWFLGVVGAGVGLYVHVYKMLPIQELIFLQVSPAFLFVVMGLVLFVTAILGFVGTLRENLSFLRWYLVTLMFLLMVHIAAGVVAFVLLFSPPTVPLNIEAMLQKALILYKEDYRLAEYINRIQISIQCCGINFLGYKEWNGNPYFACTDDNLSAERCGVPPSCCRFDGTDKIDSTCGFGITQDFIPQFEASSVINIQGCIPKAEEIIQNTAALLGFSAFGMATALICGIVLSSRMVNILEKKVDEYWKQYSLENSMMHYIPNSGIYHIPDPSATKKKDPGIKSRICNNSSLLRKTLLI